MADVAKNEPLACAGQVRHAEAISISEAQRTDLYNGLRDVLGPENTEILMGAIRLHELDEVATKRDLAELKTELMAEIGDVRGELAQLRVDVTAEIGSLRKTMTNWMLTVLVTVVGAMASLTLLA